MIQSLDTAWDFRALDLHRQRHTWRTKLRDSSAEAFGVWTEKSMYGRKRMGILRSAFLIGATGKVEQAWYKISPKDTPKKLLEALAA